jgi:hypothetical protein
MPQSKCPSFNGSGALFQGLVRAGSSTFSAAGQGVVWMPPHVIRVRGDQRETFATQHHCRRTILHLRPHNRFSWRSAIRRLQVIALNTPGPGHATIESLGDLHPIWQCLISLDGLSGKHPMARRLRPQSAAAGHPSQIWAAPSWTFFMSFSYLLVAFLGRFVKVSAWRTMLMSIHSFYPLKPDG